jgi:hypothetical protein
MQTEPAFTETELARRWNVSIKTLQRWRSEERGPPYIKLSKAPLSRCLEGNLRNLLISLESETRWSGKQW